MMSSGPPSIPKEDRNMRKLLPYCLLASIVAKSSIAITQDSSGDVEDSFRQFLGEYWPQMKARNSDYLKTVHPKLPAEAYDFFFDITLAMMQYAETNEAVEPKIECQDFNVCKVIYPQPNDSWAAQRFILYQGAWRWLDQ
jgi:hypothetical protein